MRRRHRRSVLPTPGWLVRPAGGCADGAQKSVRRSVRLQPVLRRAGRPIFLRMEKPALRDARPFAGVDVDFLQKQNDSRALRDVGRLDSGDRRDLRAAAAVADPDFCARAHFLGADVWVYN